MTQFNNNTNKRLMRMRNKVMSVMRQGQQTTGTNEQSNTK